MTLVEAARLCHRSAQFHAHPAKHVRGQEVNRDVSTQETVYTIFQRDHQQLDRLFRAFQELKRGDFARAKENFVEFKFGLQRHIVWEEDVLFPLWERETGMSEGGPTDVMRREHRVIGDWLEAIHQKVRIGEPDSDEEEQALFAVLSAHNKKEEGILYPAIDSLLSEEARARVLAALESIPEDRYKACCQ